LLPGNDDLSGGVPPILSAVPTFGVLLAALGRRWLFALVVVLTGGALTAALICFLVPARYTGEVRIQIRRAPDYMPGSGDNSTMDDYIRSQAQFLRSARVTNATLQRDEVRILAMVVNQADDPTWLARDLLIKAATGENVLSVKLTGDDPEEMNRFLSGLVEAYKKELDRDREQQKKTTGWHRREGQQGTGGPVRAAPPERSAADRDGNRQQDSRDGRTGAGQGQPGVAHEPERRC
jgi:hypothetical protein